MKKETKKPVNIMLMPSIRKMAEQLAAERGMSLSEITGVALARITNEHALVSESANMAGLTPVEAEIKFMKEWGL